MAVNRTNQVNNNRNRVSSVQASRNAYVYGNTVRKLNEAQPYEAPRRKVENRPKQRPAKAHATMSVFHTMVMLAALAICALILVNYIQLRSELTNTIETVASLEAEISNLRSMNNDTYSRIQNSIDLEEIKRIAIGELGMIYAQEGQIITYSGVEQDYMRGAE